MTQASTDSPGSGLPDPSGRLASNPFRSLLNSDETGFGTFGMLDSSMSAMVLARLGYQFLVLDVQHSPFDLRQIESAVAACVGTPCSPLARVLPDRPDQIGWVLDLGVDGVVVPLVNSPEAAAQAVSACRYPPTGRRSMGAVRNILVRGEAYPDDADGDVACVIQIEHIDAIANIDAILDVEGIDAIMPGHIDLARSMGHRLSYGPSVSNAVPQDVIDALRVVEDAGRKRSIPVIPVTGGSAEVGSALAAGHRVICCNTDFHALKNAAAEQLTQCWSATASHRAGRTSLDQPA
ncbi:aldolase/citrate lyase family protein [Streptomyces sp. GD-15H]|uniref:HpcH/HpaI aldolase family protein n=1 Tax=Streptomyces sp. GD-15H TaxID=3129112 RepID=UPI00324E8A7E